MLTCMKKHSKKRPQLMPLSTNVAPQILDEVTAIAQKEQRSLANITHLLLRLGLDAWRNGNGRNTVWLSMSGLASRDWPKVSQPAAAR